MFAAIMAEGDASMVEVKEGEQQESGEEHAEESDEETEAKPLSFIQKLRFFAGFFLRFFAFFFAFFLRCVF